MDGRVKRACIRIIHNRRIIPVRQTGFSTRATDVDRAEQMLFKRLKNGRKRKSESWILSSWMRYAATFVGIILLSGTIYLTFLKYNTEKESLLTVNTRNEVEQLTLPDGTKVWLNKNSISGIPKNLMRITGKFIWKVKDILK